MAGGEKDSIAVRLLDTYGLFPEGTPSSPALEDEQLNFWERWWIEDEIYVYRLANIPGSMNVKVKFDDS